MALDISLVFKLSSVEDLGNLHTALKQTVTFQAKVQLEQEIKRLNRMKEELTVDVEALRMEKQGLQRPSDGEKANELTEATDKAEEEATEEERPSSFRRDSERLIERLTESPTESEGEETVESDPEPQEPR